MEARCWGKAGRLRFISPKLKPVVMQGPNGQLKPIPPEDDILPRRARSKEPAIGLAGVGDADLALAIQLQDAEMDPERAQARRHGFTAQGTATRHIPRRSTPLSLL